MSYPKLKNENEIYVKMKNYISFTFSHHNMQSILKSTTSVSKNQWQISVDTNVQPYPSWPVGGIGVLRSLLECEEGR